MGWWRGGFSVSHAGADILTVTGDLTSLGGVTLGSTNFETVNVTTAQTNNALTMSATVQTLNVQAAGSYVVGAATTLTTVSGGAINATVTDDNTTAAETFRNDGTGRLTVTTVADTQTADAVTNTSTGTVTVDQVANAGVTTVNLNGNAAQDIINFSAASTGIVASGDRVNVSNFAVANDTITLDADQTTNAAASGTSTNANIAVVTAAGVLAFGAANDVLELDFNFATIGDLSAATNGSALLSGTGMTSISMAANGDDGYIVAYQNGTAYLYAAVENAADGDAAALTAAEIQLIGTFSGVATGALGATQLLLSASA